MNVLSMFIRSTTRIELYTLLDHHKFVVPRLTSIIEKQNNFKTNQNQIFDLFLSITY